MTISATSQGLRPGVCTSSNRPANPFEGQIVYETDTDMVAIWNGSAWRYIAATTPTNGAILQIVSANYSTATLNSTSTYADTGLSASITPKSSSSKILVMAVQNGVSKTDSATYVGIKLLRGSTDIALMSVYASNTSSTANSGTGSVAINYLDSPATTSSTTYKTQFRSVANTQQAIVQDGSCVSTMTLMEIAG